MKNPIVKTLISFIVSSITIIVAAIIIEYQHTSGEQYFLRTIVSGIYYQSILCYCIYIYWITSKRMDY